MEFSTLRMCGIIYGIRHTPMILLQRCLKDTMLGIPRQHAIALVSSAPVLLGPFPCARRSRYLSLRQCDNSCVLLEHDSLYSAEFVRSGLSSLREKAAWRPGVLTMLQFTINTRLLHDLAPCTGYVCRHPGTIRSTIRFP